MIGKISKGNGFGGVLRYVLQEKKGHLIDSNMHVDHSLSRNKLANDLAKQFGTYRNFNTKAKDPVFHLAVSLSKEDSVDDETFNRIGNDYLEKLGFKIRPDEEGRNQFVTVRHTDTEHQHIHIVANRIGADGKMVYLHNDWWKIKDISRELEKKYGFKLVSNTKLDTKRAPLKEINMEKRLQKSNPKYITSRKELIAKINKSTSEIGGGKRTFSSFISTLKKEGVNVNFNTPKDFSSINGISFSVQRDGENFIYKGSSLGKKYTWGSIKKTINYDEKRDLPLVKTIVEEAKTSKRFTEIKDQKEEIVNSFNKNINSFSKSSNTNIFNKTYRDKHISFNERELLNLKILNREWENDNYKTNPIKHYERSFKKHYLNNYNKDLSTFYKSSKENKQEILKEGKIQKDELKVNLSSFMKKNGYDYSNDLNKKIDALFLIKNDVNELKDLNKGWRNNQGNPDPMSYFFDRFSLHESYYSQQLEKSLNRIDNGYGVNTKSQKEEILRIGKETDYDFRLSGALKSYELELQKGSTPDVIKYINEHFNKSVSDVHAVSSGSNVSSNVRTSNRDLNGLFDNVAKGIGTGSGPSQYKEELPKNKKRKRPPLQ